MLLALKRKAKYRFQLIMDCNDDPTITGIGINTFLPGKAKVATPYMLAIVDRPGYYTVTASVAVILSLTCTDSPGFKPFTLVATPSYIVHICVWL